MSETLYTFFSQLVSEQPSLHVSDRNSSPQDHLAILEGKVSRHTSQPSLNPKPPRKGSFEGDLGFP